MFGRLSLLLQDAGEEYRQEDDARDDQAGALCEVEGPVYADRVHECASDNCAEQRTKDFENDLHVMYLHLAYDAP